MSSPQHITDLKEEILELITAELNPLREEYHYGTHDLQSFISWQPIVLIIGNYSAGKSTFINELVGDNVQRTGQAPTDDCFTVIAYQDKPHHNFVEERDGRVLLGDESLPFKRLKSQGERFLSHFRLKKVRADILKNLVLIDTPGMLDSISEKDRGYNYQEVLGELASLADLVILLFDAHKAGTIRESYHSLRTTLPKSTMEDRMLFLLNRVDECQNMDDLMRVHGALCWNLSQMTGRKDIPRIYLTFSPPHNNQELTTVKDNLLKSYLLEVSHQKQEVIHQILDVPRKRIDHLATYLEIHCQRIHQYIYASQQWTQFKRNANYTFSQWITLGIILILSGGGVLIFSSASPDSIVPPAIIASGLITLGMIILVRAWLAKKFFRLSKQHFLSHLDKFIVMNSQYEKDHWKITAPQIKHLILKKSHLLPPHKQIRLHKKDLEETIERVAYLRHQISGLSPDKTQHITDETMTTHQPTTVLSTAFPSAHPTTSHSAEPTTQNSSLPSHTNQLSSTDHKMTQIIGKQINLLDQDNAETAESS